MYVQIQTLYYWKTEHQSEGQCQDAYTIDSARGLFVVADGAGTTLYPAIWSRILVKHFVNLPLMSNNAFEIEWWVRPAQKTYRDDTPQLQTITAWNARQKALNEGSDSTLAALRVMKVQSDSLHAQLLVFGDSCILIGKPDSMKVKSFVLQEVAQFERGPICIPSDIKYFRRGFHTCDITEVDIQAGDIVIIATDAVAKWILGSGDGKRASIWDAFEAVYSQSSNESWFTFIDKLREDKEIVDDDSTALVLTFLSDEQTSNGRPAEPIGITLHHTSEQLEERKKLYSEAVAARDSEMQAIYFGDGKDLRDAQLTPFPAADQIQHNRNVADALREVLRTLQQSRNAPDFTEKVGQVWQKYAALLLQEPGAANIRETLKSRGIPLEPSSPSPPLPPPSSAPVPPAVQLPVKKNIDLSSIPQREKPEKQEPPSAEQLELALARAYNSDNDDTLLTAYEAIQQSGYPLQDFQILAQQKTRDSVDRAYKRRDAFQHLRAAIGNGYVEEIEQAYRNSNLQGTSEVHQRLNAQENTTLGMALNFRQAYQTRDDEALLHSYEQIKCSLESHILFLSEAEQQQIELVLNRTSALEQLRLALEGGNPRHIHSIYTKFSGVLQEYNGFQPDEQNRLHYVFHLIDALQNGDNTSIMNYYTHMVTSYPSVFAFTFEDWQRITQAHSRLERAKTVIVVVDGKVVSFERFRTYFFIKEIYLKHRVQHIQQELQNNLQQYDKNTLREYREYVGAVTEELQSPYFLLSILEELVNDVLIHKGMEHAEAQGISSDEFNVTELQVHIFSRLSMNDAEYRLFLQHHGISIAQANEALETMARRESFLKHLQGAARPQKLEDWLKKKRNQTTIFYKPEGVVDRQERARWLTQLMQEQ